MLSLRRRGVIAHLRSLLMVPVVLLLLLGDSSDCPDGYDAFTYDASFVSDCPSSFAAPSGVVHAVLPATSDKNTAMLEALQQAGIHATAVNVSQAGGNRCNATGFVVRRTGVVSSYACALVSVSEKVQRVQCTNDPTNVSGRVHLAEPTDAGGDVADDSSDASTPTSDASNDAASAEDAGIDDAGGAASDGGARSSDPASCAITFTK